MAGPTLAATAVAGAFHRLAGTPNLGTTLVIVAASAAVNFGSLATIQKRFGTIQPLELARRVVFQVRSRQCAGSTSMPGLSTPSSQPSTSTS